MVTNGTAVLGLGNIGPLAGKPVMEGKGCLFKKFAGIDVFDIEIAESDPDKLVDIVAALEPTFGGINLEDIKAPECFYIERKLRERMKIPVFHDDQHGTAIIVDGRGAQRPQGRRQGDRRREARGLGRRRGGARLPRPAGRGGTAQGERRRSATAAAWCTRVDRIPMPTSCATRSTTKARTLAEIVDGADIFLGLSGPGVLKRGHGREDGAPTDDPRAGQSRAGDPARTRARGAARLHRIGTGRSDYPNQVNNSLCFPFIFRGALDVRRDGRSTRR